MGEWVRMAKDPLGLFGNQNEHGVQGFNQAAVDKYNALDVAFRIMLYLLLLFTVGSPPRGTEILMVGHCKILTAACFQITSPLPAICDSIPAVLERNNLYCRQCLLVRRRKGPMGYGKSVKSFEIKDGKGPRLGDDAPTIPTLLFSH